MIKIIKAPAEFPEHAYVVWVIISATRAIPILVQTGLYPGKPYMQPSLEIRDNDKPMGVATTKKLQQGIEVATLLMNGVINIDSHDWTFIPNHR